MSKIVRIDDNTYEQLKKARGERGKTMAEIIARAVEIYLQKQIERKEIIHKAKQIVDYLEGNS